MYVKFLNENGSSHYDPSFVYPLPTDTEPGTWVSAPGPEPDDHDACGPQRLHLCNSPVPRGGARWGVPYEAQGSNKIGEDKHKTAFRYVRLLRRIPLTKIFYPGIDLSGTDLSGADLSGADLSGTNLYGADLSGTDLNGADLSRANLTETNLYETNLTQTNYYEINLNKE